MNFVVPTATAWQDLVRHAHMWQLFLEALSRLQGNETCTQHTATDCNNATDSDTYCYSKGPEEGRMRLPVKIQSAALNGFT